MIPALSLTGLNGPIIREAIPFPSILLEVSSFFSPSFFNGSIPCEQETYLMVRVIMSMEKRNLVYHPGSKNSFYTVLHLESQDQEMNLISAISAMCKSIHIYTICNTSKHYNK